MEVSPLISLVKKHEKGVSIKEEEEEISSNVEKYSLEEAFYDLPIHSISNILNNSKPIPSSVAKNILRNVSKRNGSSTVNLLRYLSISDPTVENIIGIMSCIRGCPIFENLRELTSVVDEDQIEDHKSEPKAEENMEDINTYEEEEETPSEFIIDNSILNKFDNNIKIRGYIEDIVFTNEHKDKDLLSKLKDPIFSDYAYQCILYAIKIRPLSLEYLNSLINILPFDPPQHLSDEVSKFVSKMDKSKNSIKNDDKNEEEECHCHDHDHEDTFREEEDVMLFDIVFLNDEIDNRKNVVDIIKKDDFEALKTLLVYDEIETVYCEETDANIPLICLAAFYGSSSCFRYLRLNSSIGIDDMITRYSIKGGSNDIINICANEGIDFRKFCKTAAKYHRNAVLEWIINNYGFEKVSPSVCIESCNTPAFFFFLPKLGVDHVDRFGDTSLLKCSARGDVDIVDYLISNGANIEFRNSRGQTALSVAAEFGHSVVIEYLIDNDANIESKDNYGRTALICACEQGQINSIVTLIERGADIESKTITGLTPLISAVIRGKKEAVSVLLSHGADPNKTDNLGKTALSRSKDEEISKLIESKINKNQ